MEVPGAGSAHMIRRRASPASSSQGLSARAQGKQPERTAAEDRLAVDGDYDSKAKPAGAAGNVAGAARVDNLLNDFDAYAKRTQDRLEAWFGIADPPDGSSSRGWSRSSAASTSTMNPASSHSSESTATYTNGSGFADPLGKGKAPAPSAGTPDHSRGADQPDDGTSLVYLHRVRPEETLAGISLQYGIEPSLLRRVNKLWAGDKPQMRGTLYLPVHACTRDPTQQQQRQQSDPNGISDSNPLVNTSPAASSSSHSGGHGVALGFWNEERGLVREVDRQEAAPHLAGAGGSSASATAPLQEGHLRQHDRLQLGAASGAAATASSRSWASSSAAGSAFAPAPQISRVPKEELNFFSSSSGGAIGGGHASKGSTGFGQSGLDDLLQISHERSVSLSVTGDDAGSGAGKGASSVSLLDSDNRGSADAEDKDDARSDAGTSYSDRLAEDRWKPNKWTIGGPKKPPLDRAGSNQSVAPSTSSAAPNASPPTGLRPLHLVNSRLGPSIPAAEEGLQRASSGWNDTPASLLSSQPPAGANVSHAYSGKKKKSHHRILNDLAAGLPPNPGPASGWQRPIGASLPPPPVATGPPRSGASGGLGKVLNDAFRGRISVEGALEAVYDTVTGKAATSLPPPPRRVPSGGPRAPVAAIPPNRADLRSGTGSLGRVSAEEARASLSVRGSMDDDAGARGQELGGVQLDSIVTSSTVQPHLRPGTLANGTGPHRVRSRTNLKDVEWHKD